MATLLALALVAAQVPADGGSDDAPLPPPHEYLYASYPTLASRLDCMITMESQLEPGASAVRGRYVGLAQFDYPTWMETPQGQSGLSRWDPYASIDAMAWGVRNLGFGRWPVSSRRC